MKKFFAFATLVIALAGCNPKPNAEKLKNPNAKVDSIQIAFNAFLEEYYQVNLKMNPLEATGMGDNRYNNLLPNFLSDEYKTESKNFNQSTLEGLNNFSKENLSKTQQLSYDVLQWTCEMNLAEMEFSSDLTPINQMWTLNLSFAQLASGQGAQPFNTVEDYHNWLQRVDGYLIWLQSTKTKMQEGIAQNYVLPKSLIKKIIPQLKAMITQKAEDHLFYMPINNLPSSFTEDEKATLTEAFKSMIEEKLVPTYQDLHQFVSTTYLAAGRETSGISDVPNGEAEYQFRIKKYTTTNMTAQEVHQLGLDEVERISKEMEKVKTQVGFEGDLKAFFDFVRTNKKLMPYTDAQQIIDNFNQIHETIKPQVAKLFDKTPKTGFEVRRTEAFREASSSAEYNQGSKDGTRPGIFYVPIPDASQYNVFSDEALFLHEAIPGHHFQVSLTQENEELPEFRKTLWYSAYGEGWALYTESLGEELGLYTDPYLYFGMLGMEMHRAIRLVVDPGMHVMGWSREKAIQYSLDNEAEPEASIISEIERYMANPGQALSYKVGQLKILELRAKAEKALGDQFDIKEFHNQVLETGCIPLALLEAKIDDWIAEASK
jgi:uncharacterized protein (DUF885 family)